MFPFIDRVSKFTYSGLRDRPAKVGYREQSCYRGEWLEHFLVARAHGF